MGRRLHASDAAARAGAATGGALAQNARLNSSSNFSPSNGIAFAAVAILTMALGIGATTALFSVTYGVPLKPLAWPDADRLVRVTETRKGHEPRVRGTMSNRPYHTWMADHSTIEAIGG